MVSALNVWLKNGRLIGLNPGWYLHCCVVSLDMSRNFPPHYISIPRAQLFKEWIALSSG